MGACRFGLAIVRHPGLNEAHQRVMIDRPEAVTQIGVEHPIRSPVHRDPNGLTGHVSRAFRAEPETRREEIGLEDWFEDDLRGCYDAAIRDRWDRKGTRRAWGMYTRRSGEGRYVRSFNATPRRAKNTPTPDASTASMVTPSTPGAPRLEATSDHARHKMSLRAT
jgi:hypothetical protein